MTEFELRELGQIVFGNALAAQSLYISALFAYLVVAYLAGARLSKSQVATVTGIFSLFCILLLFSIFTLSDGLRGIGQELMSINSELMMRVAVPRIVPFAVTAVYACGYLAALIFMVQIRRKARSDGG